MTYAGGGGASITTGTAGVGGTGGGGAGTIADWNCGYSQHTGGGGGASKTGSGAQVVPVS